MADLVDAREGARGERVRVAFIGCGGICDYHAAAMKAAGLEITAVCSRPGSRTPYDFAARHGIPRVLDGPDRLLEARELWDALVIAVPPEATLPLLRRAVAMGVPVLVEKPAARTAAGLKPFTGQELPVIVGYNRRFYPPVRRLRELVGGSREPFVGHLVIAEPVEEPEGDRGFDAAQAFARRVRANGVHALDLLRFVMGPLQIAWAQPVQGADGRPTGIAASLFAPDSGSRITVSATWNAPANVSLSLMRPGLRAVLEPLEELRLYRSLERIEPTAELPLRRYVPRLGEKVVLDEVDLTHKPGFYRQARALRALVLRKRREGLPDATAVAPQEAAEGCAEGGAQSAGKDTDGGTRDAGRTGVAATLDDAYDALSLAEGLLATLNAVR